MRCLRCLYEGLSQERDLHLQGMLCGGGGSKVRRLRSVHQGLPCRLYCDPRKERSKMKNKKNKKALLFRILALVLAALMVLSVATYILYAFAGLM